MLILRHEDLLDKYHGDAETVDGIIADKVARMHQSLGSDARLAYNYLQHYKWTQTGSIAYYTTI